MRRKAVTRLLSMLLTALMLLGIFPASALAAEIEPETTVTAEAEMPEATPEVTPEVPVEVTPTPPVEESPAPVETPAVEPEVSPTPDPDIDEIIPDEEETGEEDEESDEELDETEVVVVPVTTYAGFMSALSELEGYASSYAAEHPETNAAALIINYIRCGVEKYTSGTWTAFCGPENTAFSSYVEEQDISNVTNARGLRQLSNFYLPNGNEVDFTHMFGCLDMAYHTGNQQTADLGSWAGDICDLIQLTTNAGVTGTVEEMAEEIRTNDRYFLYDDPDAHSFGILDLYGDLDAFYILNRLYGGNSSIYSIMNNYFTVGLTDEIRAKFFVENRLGGVTAKNDIRDAVYNIYIANEGLKTLEGTYVPTGVNADLRQACCYAFADYLYITAGYENSEPYYTVFSSSASSLAPGITQEIKMAQTRDNKQIVYYIATADVSRSDVHVYANYNNNDGSSWGMARVTDQMAAAEAKHTNPDDQDNYIENYSAVVGVNADFYNMQNGAPMGALVMGGVEYHGVSYENFFGILKNGTPVIGGSAEWSAYAGQIQEAVGAGAYLVKDGKVQIEDSSDYYNDRVSRTCAGITYDGRIVLMVLDGRQEPFSAGGSAQEIAQIMLDAGCVSAVNLDGGGSTTFAAKPEGSDTITVVNRPSDGYARSVSSSLLVVSTAKPSTEFDHAIISADYDYLTVGTELDITVAGVTGTGGAVDLPEGSVLKVSDESIGGLSDNVFTAAALGDVKIQLVSADGAVLGSKTIHVVEPKDIGFTKTRLNGVYGVPVDLPLEASYNGNVVKINTRDVQFGYLKITLTSIGELEGGSVNTTKTELVFNYPEAGTIEGFSFTPNAEGGLRTLTIGAVLSSKLGEFQQTINDEYAKAYAAAKANGYSDEEAALQAQTAGINKALDTAAKISVYMYNDSEANFDFDNAQGDSLLAWKREVPNSVYVAERSEYILTDLDNPAEVQYTFAVDMSKVPIPEKLTGLLYMLPGGDQEGRTAWDFLLQLAERISPLTTVRVTLTIPDGFTVDTEKLRLANEYFTLTSATVEDNKLTVICNFIEQSEPINPTTANPLCVLSGLKLIANDNAAWSDDGILKCDVSGELDYDIYAHFHVLMSLASQEEYQQKYGLYPYDNRANSSDDYGAHFANSIASFSDSFTLQKNNKDGWVRENGGWYYYDNGTILTGVQELASFVNGEDGTFWYDLGADGKCSGKLTGFFEKNGQHYYARLGILATGWQSIMSENGESYFYYFDKNSGVMLTGETEADVKGLVYTFDDSGKLIRGAFRTDANGTKYFVAGESWFRRFVTLEEGVYWIERDGYVAYGNAPTVTDNVMDATWYHFDEKTGLMTGLCDGFISYKGKLYYCDENGKPFYGVIKVEDGIIFTATLGEVYVDTSCYIDSNTNQKGCALETGKYLCDKNGYIIGNGFVDIEGSTYYFNDYNRAKGFTKIGDDYYLFNAGSGKMYKDATMWVPANNYGVEGGMHYFQPDGKMYVPDLEHGVKKIVSENGKLYFTIDGVKMTNGLNELDGEYYYAQTNGVLAVNSTIWVSQKNGLIPEKGDWHAFDAEGKLIQTGFVTGGGYTYYYDNNVLALGFTKIGDDYYLFNAGSGKMYKDATMWVPANNYGVEGGMHYFQPDGKMYVPDLEHGVKKIVSENGKLYFTIDGVKMTNGLNELDGEYYYAQTNGVLAVNSTIWVSQKNGLIPEKGDWHAFDAEGKLIQTGFVTGGGYTYYYDNNVLALGFTKVGEDYYFFNAGSGKMYTNSNLWVGSNAYGVAGGMHHFGADGKMDS